jgi:hypothetical protein
MNEKNVYMLRIIAAGKKYYVTKLKLEEQHETLSRILATKHSKKPFKDEDILKFNFDDLHDIALKLNSCTDKDRPTLTFVGIDGSQLSVRLFNRFHTKD